MKILDLVDDVRSGCKSVLTTMTLEEYKKLSFFAFNNNGNIDGQRSVIKRSSTAAKIRKRMADDFRKGAIFPQVVLGVLFSTENMQNLDESKFYMLLESVNEGQISIIDGMQRSNIYFENYEDNKQQKIRVEFWCSDASTKLLYRMLVLNTGQVPWNTRRQLEVIFDGISNKISEEIKKTDPLLDIQLNILAVDEIKRRKAGMFKKSSLIEMYLGFNTRKVNVDVNDELADEFQRFDMMEAIDSAVNFEMFVDTFRNLCKLDFAVTATSETVEGKYNMNISDALKLHINEAMRRDERINALAILKIAGMPLIHKMYILLFNESEGDNELERINNWIYDKRCSIAHFRYGQQKNEETYVNEEILEMMLELLVGIFSNMNQNMKDICSGLVKLEESTLA